MLVKPSAEELLTKAKNRYELAIAVSKRARQINNGSPARVNTDQKSPVTISALELAADKYEIIEQE